MPNPALERTQKTAPLSFFDLRIRRQEMRGNRILSTFGATVISICVGFVCYAQPNISIDKIPVDIPPDVKLEIERLYSTKSHEQAHAMIALKKMGERASPAIPFLIATFNNSLQVQLHTKGAFFTIHRNTFTGELAADTLAGIGSASIDPLIFCLNDINMNPRGYAAKALGKIDNIRAIEPLIKALDYANKKDKGGWAIEYTVTALQKITGKDFRTDADRWRQWWKENKDNYQKSR